MVVDSGIPFVQKHMIQYQSRPSCKAVKIKVQITVDFSPITVAPVVQLVTSKHSDTLGREFKSR